MPPKRSTVFATSPASESPEIRKYAAWRVCNTVEIGHELGAKFAVYWPGSLGYQIQGAVEETETLRWYADSLNAACERDIEVAKARGVPTLKHCLEAKPFEPQAEILLPTSDASQWALKASIQSSRTVLLTIEASATRPSAASARGCSARSRRRPPWRTT